MKGTAILFEPMPIGRLGVRSADDEVIIGTDFSSFAYVLEEFVSLAALEIVIPRSFPECAALPEAPALLRQRIRVIDDSLERDATDKILYPILKELGLEINADNGECSKPDNVPRPLLSHVNRIRRDVKCLALGFNHSLHIDVQPMLAMSSSRKIREHVQQPETRAILANFEGFFSYYEDLTYDSVTPPPSMPAKMVSTFDRLIHDREYNMLSENVSMLSDPLRRRGALSRIATLGRNIIASDRIGAGWSYLSKVIKVWTGVPVPETNVLSVFFQEERCHLW